MRDKAKNLLIATLVVLMILAAACNPAQPTEEPATEVPVETEQPTQPPTEAPTATQPEETAEESEEAEETEEPDDSQGDDAMSSGETSACVECHTDQAMLIDTADPVEEVASENEGAG
jgi:hypothetical protein